MKRFLYLLIILVGGIVIAGCDSGHDSSHDNKNIPYDELRKLDALIAEAPGYISKACALVDSDARRAEKLPHGEAAMLYADLTNRMSVMDADSAMDYANQSMKHAVASGVDSVIMYARLARLSSLTSAGIFNLAEKELTELEQTPMTLHERLNFLQIARQLYSYLYFYTVDYYPIAETFRKKSIAYDDSLIIYFPHKNDFCRFLVLERMVLNGDYHRARAGLDSMMRRLKPGEHLYGMCAYQMALTYKASGNERLYCTYMARAAGSDIQCGVREGLAMFGLANWLYEQGNVADAFRYINFAMREAMDGNARMRAVNIASMLPMIDETYRQNNKQSHDRLSLYVIISVILLLITIIVLTLLAVQHRRIAIDQRKLRALSKLQETHTANFLALCSTYYHKLNSLEMLVQRKIASGQTDELLKLLKSGRYTEEGKIEIFDIFDRSFLVIYPDFIEQINSLLRPEERYEKGDGTTLHNELRIYALVKMGITESIRIAQILNYSVNTVYAYRNKMRNKAVNRDTFDDDVIALSRNKRASERRQKGERAKSS